ncbi:peptidase S41 [Fibrella aestuarina BUZ 2]|uniref:Peptidase S41 n=1 Tax=Fibrella aestuarina BUZ 2 TaxID=1166018 RepID=I0KFZ7_9BACT|nr:S41 family peptidase [Fibrella aestuarina]CCH03050.1 peptidase S41 [Fibrella aestuarina BUZ 2]
MKTVRLLTALLLGIHATIAFPQSDSLRTRRLTPAAMQADVAYLRRLLQETHPGLYRYVPRPVMQARLDSLAGQLQHPLPFYAFYGKIEGLLASIRCAHTHALPHKDFDNLFRRTWKTLPFFMVPTQNKSYVLFSVDERVKPGYELLTINGQSINAIQAILEPYHWDDGFIQTSRSQAMKGWLFNLFYYWFIDQPDTYRLTFKNLSGDTVRVEAPAMAFTAAFSQMQKLAVNKQMLAWYNTKPTRHPWRVTFPDDVPQTAHLRIDSFGGRGVNSSAEAVTVFNAFMDKLMATLTKKGIQHLIVDLRANPGGWDSQGIELFRYLAKADTAVQYCARQHSLTNDIESEFIKFSDLSEANRKNVKNELEREADGTFTLKGSSARFTPKPNRFRGNVYILMDGASASTTSEFLAVAHANRVGTFIGEESGGAYEGGNGGSFVHLTLPQSGIQVTTPLVSYRNAVPEPLQKGRGTLPDHAVSFTLDDVLNHTDSVLTYTKELIRKGGK